MGTRRVSCIAQENNFVSVPALHADMPIPGERHLLEIVELLLLLTGLFTFSWFQP
jgi:hypothetical protein